MMLPLDKRLVMKKALWFLLVFIAPITAFNQYFEDAGRIVPFSEEAKISTSGGKGEENITDNNINTFWESDPVLPENYIKRPDLNQIKSISSETTIALFPFAFDRNLNTSDKISKPDSDGKYRIRIDFKSATSIKLCSFKTSMIDSIYLLVEKNKKISVQSVLTSSNNYQLNEERFSDSEKINSLRLVSKSPFDLFEFAILIQEPTVYAEIDLGKQIEVGQLYIRHLSGNNTIRTEISYSNDRSNWKTVCSLSPYIIPLLPIVLNDPLNARYLRLTHTLTLEPYAKANIWEIKVYDRFGPFGKPQNMAPNKLTMRNRIGVNGFWGWGFNTYDDILPEGHGSAHFFKIGNLARSYHNLDWDIPKPGLDPEYEKMSVNGTKSKEWLNWDREYKSWKNTGFSIDATIQFNQDMVPETSWKDPYHDSYRYAIAFSKHFGITNKLIDYVEIGNEPWDYPQGLYKTILDGMSEGFKSTDSHIKILPAAFQACFRQFESGESDNYIGGKISINALNRLDGLNGHCYSHCFSEDGKRQSVAPEDPRSDLLNIRNLVRFRDRNLPQKPVFITEFGYDSDGGGESCEHNECVSENQQSAWGLRATLLLLRNNAEAVYWYFFANENRNSVLHSRSGLCSSSAVGFIEKKSFKVFEQFQLLLGECYLKEIVSESNYYYLYLFENESTKQQYALIWTINNSDPSIFSDISCTFPSKALSINYLDDETEWIGLQNQSISSSIHINGFPAVVRLQ